MSLNYRQVASCRPSDASDVYIFTILPIADRGIAAITSNDHLYLLDSTTLQPSHTVPPSNLPKNLTSLAVADNGYSTICAGADGVVTTFDVRTRAPVGHFQTGTSTYISPPSHICLTLETSLLILTTNFRQTRQRLGMQRN